MAQPVTWRMDKISLHCCALMGLGLLASAGFAENLPDPTRPTGAAYADANAVNVPAGPVLQSVLTSAGRKVAIINGQTVKQGDMVGDARVSRIADAEVVLTRGGETQVLKLFPVVEKQPSTVRPASGSGTGK